MGAITNRGTSNICTGFLWIYAFISLGKTPRSEMAGSYGKSMFNFFKELLNIFHNSCSHFTFPPALYESSRFFTSLQTLGIGNHVNVSIFTWAYLPSVCFPGGVCWNILPIFLFNGLFLIIKFWGSFIGSIVHWQMSSNCLTVLARTSCEIWKRSGGHPCLAPDLQGKTIHLSYLGWHQL